MALKHEIPTNLNVPDNWPDLITALRSNKHPASFIEYHEVLQEIDPQSHYSAIEASLPFAVVPGVFQTPAYIGKLAATSGSEHRRNLNSGTATRLGRGALMIGSGATQDYIMGETALEYRSWQGNATVLRDQLRRIQAVTSEHPEISVRITPKYADNPHAFDSNTSSQLFYPSGVDGVSHGFIETSDIPVTVQVTQSGIQGIAERHRRVANFAFSAEESQAAIAAAIDSLSRRY